MHVRARDVMLAQACFASSQNAAASRQQAGGCAWPVLPQDQGAVVGGATRAVVRLKQAGGDARRDRASHRFALFLRLLRFSIWVCRFRFCVPSLFRESEGRREWLRGARNMRDRGGGRRRGRGRHAESCFEMHMYACVHAYALDSIF